MDIDDTGMRKQERKNNAELLSAKRNKKCLNIDCYAQDYFTSRP